MDDDAMDDEEALFVISNFDLVKFGCPYCGEMSGGLFITNGTCSIWGCVNCTHDSLIVVKHIQEIYQFEITNTKIVDLIGTHPYQDMNFQINSFTAKLNCIPLC